MKKLILMLSVLLLWTMVCGPWTAYAAVPHIIAYQGRLTDSAGTPLDGSYSITFRIYDAEAAGNLLWQETHPNVTVQDGIFDVLLGSITALNLPFDIQYYLAIQVGSDPEMTPRQQIASAGYAYRAEHGVPRGVITMWSGSASTIPSGWALCDGTNGTPNLRDRFIVGAGGEYAVDAVGGEKQHTLTIAEMPQHSHARTFFPNTGEGGVKPKVNNAWDTYNPWSINTDSAGGNQPHENRPPYYALCYIMKL